MHTRIRALTALLALALLGSFQSAHAQSPVSWWRADGNALDSISNNNGILQGGVGYGPGAVGLGFVFNGTNGVVKIPDSPSLAISGSLRITAQIYVNQLPASGNLGQIFFRGDDRDGLDPYGLVVLANGTIDFHLSDAAGNNADVFAPVPLQQWVSVDASLDNTTGKMVLILNHQIANQMTTSIRPFPNLDPNEIPGLAIGNTQDPSSFNEPFNGTIDELKVYSTVFSTHVLWANTNGQISLWNYSPSDASYTFNDFGPFPGWTATATADGGTNGQTRILWTNTDGTASIWGLDNTLGSYTFHNFGPYPGWAAKALSVASDNTTHVLWTHTADGQVSIWNYSIKDGTFTQNTFGPFPGWTAKAIADGGTDGKTRVLWTNTNGAMSLWSLDSSTGAYTHAEYGPYPGWTASLLSVAAGSVSVGMGNTTHVLWQNTNGQVSLWNDNTATGGFTYQNYGPYPGWSAASLADSPDGKTEVLWNKADGTMSLWDLDNTTGLFSYSNYGPYAGWTATGLSTGP